MAVAAENSDSNEYVKLYYIIVTQNNRRMERKSGAKTKRMENGTGLRIWPIFEKVRMKNYIKNKNNDRQCKKKMENVWNKRAIVFRIYGDNQ